jgi:hypothetical protein
MNVVRILGISALVSLAIKLEGVRPMAAAVATHLAVVLGVAVGGRVEGRESAA